MNAMLDRVEQSSRPPAALRRRRLARATQPADPHPLRDSKSTSAHPDTADLARRTAASSRRPSTSNDSSTTCCVLARNDARHRPGQPPGRRRPRRHRHPRVHRLRLTTAASPSTLSGVSAAQVTATPTNSTRVVRNLLDNAARHARTTITVTLAEHDGTPMLTVADDGPAYRPIDSERVFERFARLDEARARDRRRHRPRPRHRPRDHRAPRRHDPRRRRLLPGRPPHRRAPTRRLASASKCRQGHRTWVQASVNAQGTAVGAGYGESCRL